MSKQQVEFQSDRVAGDLRSWLLDRLRDEQDRRPWSERSEEEQRNTIAEAMNTAKDVVRQIVSIVSSEGEPAIDAKIKTVQSDGETIKAQVTVERHEEGALALFAAAGKPVKIIVADAARFLGEGDAVRVNPDQPDLPGTEDRRAHGPAWWRDAVIDPGEISDEELKEALGNLAVATVGTVEPGDYVALRDDTVWELNGERQFEFRPDARLPDPSKIDVLPGPGHEAQEAEAAAPRRWAGGSGKPDQSLGENGNAWLDFDTRTSYEKRRGRWVKAPELLDEEDGAEWYSARLGPADDMGAVGDHCWHQDQQFVYTKHDDGWRPDAERTLRSSAVWWDASAIETGIRYDGIGEPGDFAQSRESGNVFQMSAEREWEHRPGLTLADDQTLIPIDPDWFEIPPELRRTPETEPASAE